MSKTCPITAIVPACERVESLARTLRVITSCDPAPAEIIVYVDGGSPAVVEMLERDFPTVRVIVGKGGAGPGGARNELISAAGNEWAANFDDDSFPDHTDYFQRVLDGVRRFPKMAVLSASSMQVEKEMLGYMRIGIFSGCGCVFSRNWFLRTQGHVPLPVAYCMEEADVSLQLCAIGGHVIHDPKLCVRHEHEAERVTFTANKNARILANTALLAFLRYPLLLAPLGAWNVISRILFLLRMRWTKGLIRGLLLIPVYFWRYHTLRKPVAMDSVLEWLVLRNHPELLRHDA